MNVRYYFCIYHGLKQLYTYFWHVQVKGNKYGQKSFQKNLQGFIVKEKKDVKKEFYQKVFEGISLKVRFPPTSHHWTSK